MLNQLVDSNIALWVGISEQIFFVWIGVRWVNVAILAETVGRTIFQHVDDTASTYVVATGALVATEIELRINLKRQVLRYLEVGLDVQVRTTYARTKDDTLIFALSDRGEETSLVATAGDLRLVE